jgi:hypothetical protein
MTASPSPLRRHARRLTTLGTWLVQVRLLTACTGGTSLPPFYSMLTFHQGGTLTGSTVSAAFAPGQRGADQGSWRQTGSSSFTSSSLAFINFASAAAPPTSPGYQTGGQHIVQQINMSGPSSFTSTASVTFFDLAGNAYRNGCAVATGQRLD